MVSVVVVFQLLLCIVAIAVDKCELLLCSCGVVVKDQQQRWSRRGALSLYVTDTSCWMQDSVGSKRGCLIRHF